MRPPLSLLCSGLNTQRGRSHSSYVFPIFTALIWTLILLCPSYIVAPRTAPSVGGEAARGRAVWDSPSPHLLAVVGLVHPRVQLALGLQRRTAGSRSASIYQDDLITFPASHPSACHDRPIPGAESGTGSC